MSAFQYIIMDEAIIQDLRLEGFQKKGAEHMRCGTECFIVTFEKDDALYMKEAKARSQIEARRMVSSKYGPDSQIKKIVKKYK